MRRAPVFMTISILFLGMAWVNAQSSWVPVVGSTAEIPAGFADADNRIAMSSVVLGGTLYVGTFNDKTAASLPVGGSEVWRSDDGTSWDRHNNDGFGGTSPENNVGAYSMAVFGGKVYAATWASGTPSTPGAPSLVWRLDEPVWNVANSVTGFPGSSNAEPWAMEVFPNLTSQLYVGVANYPNGARLWRSSDGSTWLQANSDGFGNDANDEISSIAYFHPFLYVATRNDATGLELWRSDVTASEPGHWSRVNATPGFGGANHIAAYSMEVFGSHLYLSTTNPGSGGSVYRSSDGATWNAIAQSAGGFGDANNRGGYAMAVHDGALYLGTFNLTTGTEVWSTTDGTTWYQVNADGFGIQKNYAVFSWSELDGILYASLRNDDGCQIWRLALFADGFENGGLTGWSVPKAEPR